jgi:hypothetical protein
VGSSHAPAAQPEARGDPPMTVNPNRSWAGRSRATPLPVNGLNLIPEPARAALTEVVRHLGPEIGAADPSSWAVVHQNPDGERGHCVQQVELRDQPERRRAGYVRT